MKDLIWTLIVVWLMYRIVDLFRISAAKRSENPVSKQSSTQSPPHTASRSEKDLKNALKKHLNNEGEYVDFEDVK